MTRQGAPQGARPIASPQSDHRQGTYPVGHGLAALGTAALVDVDRMVLAAVLTGQVPPAAVDAYPWGDQDSRDVVAAVAWLHRRWHHTGHRVEQVIRIDGHIVAVEDVAAHPYRERVTVGLEVPRLAQALEATGCPRPNAVAAWATDTLRAYRAAVAPNVSAAAARHLPDIVAVLVDVDLRAARERGDVAAAQAIVDQIRQAIA